MEQRLTTAFQARSPAVARLAGTKVFSALCRAYIHTDPPGSAVIVGWGRTLPEFLEEFGPTEAVAFLPDIARLEWARWRALYAADARPISAVELSIAATLHPELLLLRLHPSVWALASAHPVVSIWERKSSPLSASPLAGWVPEAVLVARVDEGVTTERVSPAAAAFVDALAGGVTLAEARRRGRELEPGFQSASLLGRLLDLGLLIGAGWGEQMTPALTRRRLLATATAALLAPKAEAGSVPQELARPWPEADFSRAAVPFEEVISGGVPRDGIPALTAPAMHRVRAEPRIEEAEPVMTVELTGAAPRAYPLRYLTWHEIVNDTVEGTSIAVTFCPLCNSGLVFDRRLDGAVLEFGVSGLLRHPDLIMYDRQTFSCWQQFTGEAIVGRLTGRRLDLLVSWMEAWGALAARNPDSLVMDERRGHARAYGRNPYIGYDSSPRPFLYRGEDPPHGIPPLARVLRVGDRAWPLERLRDEGEIEEAGLSISWRSGMASALDGALIAEGRDGGQIRVRDARTGADVVHEVVFAFAFHAFEPHGRWMLGR